MFSSKIRRVTALAVVPAAAFAALSLGTAVAQAAPVGQYQDSSVQIFDNPIPLQHIDAITSITAAASWAHVITGPYTTPTDLGNSITVVPVPSYMQAQLTAGGSFGTLTWSIVNEVNIPSGVLIGLNPASGLLTVAPPAGPVIANNNQDITVEIKVTDGTAVAFETLTAQPIIVAGGVINAINVTAVTDAVTLAGTNDNANGTVVFNSTSTPAVDPVTWAATNLPDGTNNAPGVTLTGNVLSATSTVPGAYNDMVVTDTDAMGATASDRFDILVKGGVISPSTPVLSGGHAACGVNHSRMNVFYMQSGDASWDHFTIVGPGAINGHNGWVYGNLGLNEAVYGGLLAGHGYTVYYQPVTGQGSSTPILGSHWGYVYFKAGQGC